MQVPHGFQLPYPRFNRNIMECKFEYFNKSKRRTFSFNRNIMECKFVSTLCIVLSNPVLIETLWNVNIFER